MNPLRNVICTILVMLSFSPFTSSAQSANEVIRAFMKLQAHIETGISKRDYSAALADVNFELTNFESSPQATSQPDVLNELKRAMVLHLEATMLWNSGRVIEDGALGKKLLEKYPDMVNSAAVVLNYVNVEQVLPFLWRDSVKHVASARALLAEDAARNTAAKESEQIPASKKAKQGSGVKKPNRAISDAAH